MHLSVGRLCSGPFVCSSRCARPGSEFSVVLACAWQCHARLRNIMRLARARSGGACEVAHIGGPHVKRSVLRFSLVGVLPEALLGSVCECACVCDVAAEASWLWATCSSVMPVLQWLPNYPVRSFLVPDMAGGAIACMCFTSANSYCRPFIALAVHVARKLAFLVCLSVCSLMSPLNRFDMPAASGLHRGRTHACLHIGAIMRAANTAHQMLRLQTVARRRARVGVRLGAALICMRWRDPLRCTCQLVRAQGHTRGGCALMIRPSAAAFSHWSPSAVLVRKRVASPQRDSSEACGDEREEQTRHKCALCLCAHIRMHACMHTCTCTCACTCTGMLFSVSCWRHVFFTLFAHPLRSNGCFEDLVVLLLLCQRSCVLSFKRLPPSFLRCLC